MPTPDEARAIGHAISALRPAWLATSVATWINNNVPTRPARDVMLALVVAAYDPKVESPGALNRPGPWWDTASHAGQLPRESGLVTYCEHGRPGALHCPDCRPPSQRVGPTSEQRAAIRTALREGHAATAQRHNPGVIPGKVA